MSILSLNCDCHESYKYVVLYSSVFVCSMPIIGAGVLPPTPSGVFSLVRLEFSAVPVQVITR